MSADFVFYRLTERTCVHGVVGAVQTPNDDDDDDDDNHWSQSDRSFL